MYTLVPVCSVDLDDILLFLWKFCAIAHSLRRLLWNKVQQQELWFGYDRFSSSSPTRRSAYTGTTNYGLVMTCSAVAAPISAVLLTQVQLIIVW